VLPASGEVKIARGGVSDFAGIRSFQKPMTWVGDCERGGGYNGTSVVGGFNWRHILAVIGGSPSMFPASGGVTIARGRVFIFVEIVISRNL
jgi:hypothetical protein